MNRSLLFLLPLFLMMAISCSQDSNNGQSDKEKDRSRSLQYERPVSFLSAKNDTISSIKAALADNDKKRSHGLMDVRKLPISKGMLFIFDENKPRGFWMANTPLPLDIIFVNADKEIVRIHHNTKPFSEKSLNSDKPAQYVIETNAGYCIAHDIKEGMKVAF